MKFEIGLSRRAYARRRGVTDKAVRKAITSGRIAAAVLPDHTIDADLADRLWEGNTDPSQRRGKEALRAEASMAALAAAQEAAGFERAAEPEEEGRSPIEAPIEDRDDDEEDGGPRPIPLRREDFEEDQPRRRPLSDDQMDAAEALAAHVAANRGRAAAGQPRPSEGAAIGEDAEALLALALEEKREKVRKLRIANDEKEKLLIPGKPAEAHAFAFVRAISENWQLWPDDFGPELAAKYGLESRELIQDLRDAVRARLKLQSGVEDLRLHG